MKFCAKAIDALGRFWRGEMPTQLIITVLITVDAFIAIIIAVLLTKPYYHLSKPLDLACNIIHEPASGCPAGYLRESYPRFERDGKKQYACEDTTRKKKSCIDVLNPGESIDMWFPMEPMPLEEVVAAPRKGKT